MWNSHENITLYFALSFLYIKYVQLYKPFTGHMRFDILNILSPVL